MKYTANDIIVSLGLELNDTEDDINILRAYDEERIAYFNENRTMFLEILIRRKRKAEQRKSNDWIKSAAAMLVESDGKAELDFGGGGYQNMSRSNRSVKAIEEYRVPLSHITRALIDDFCANEGISEELQSKSVKAWKEAAIASWDGEWHHTSKHYNRTKHYSLKEAAEFLSKI